MKITMYELLGLVKDGKAPNKVKYQNSIFSYNKEEKDYETILEDNSGLNLFNLVLVTPNLNDTVEILEEEKKIPEKLPFEEGKINDNEFLAKYITHNRNAINKIIDYLNYLKKQRK